MNNEEEINPFADPSIRKATAQSLTNQETLTDYSPFNNKTKPVKTSPVLPEKSGAAVLSTGKTISPGFPTNSTVQSREIPTTRIDLSQLEKQQAELDERERRIAERERELRNSQAPLRSKNFPPFPDWFPCRPCFYQDISVEIPQEFQLWVRYLYYLWLGYCFTLMLNFLTALSYFIIDKQAWNILALSIFYLALFTPCSYVFWFRPVYRAFREDSASSFMIFFLVFFIQIIITALQALGMGNLGCGFILMVKLFSAGGPKIFVGLLSLAVTAGFSAIALADGLLLIKVHRLYRQSGATLEQAQQEFQSAFVNNPTVRGAAREVTAAGLNETFRSSGQQQQRTNN